MKWILIAMMHGSSGMGPTVPVAITAEFDDKPACEAAAVALAQMSRIYRVMRSEVSHLCLPKASEGK